MATGETAERGKGWNSIAPAPPPVELDAWKRLSHLERIKPLAQDWAINGFGAPYFVYLLYIVKLLIYAGGGLLVISVIHARPRVGSGT